jgi:hypothetical protein
MVKTPILFNKTLVIGILILFIGMSIVSSTDNFDENISGNSHILEYLYSSENRFDSTSYYFWLYGPLGTGFYALYPNGTYNFCEWEGTSSFSGGTWTNDGRYLCCEYELGYLYDVDPETLEANLIGGGGVGLNGLAYDPVEYKLYGASSNSLYEVDMNTGEQNYIGSFGIGTTMIAIAFDIDGICYGWDVLFSGESHLYKIDTNTGEATVVGGMGYNLIYNQDGAFELDTDILYLVAYTSGQGCLLECDEDTGECTFIGHFEGVTNPTALAISYEYDITAPVTTHSLDPPEPDGLNGWYVSDITVTLNATDDMSGVKEIRYTICGGAEQVIPGSNGKFVLTQDGDDIVVKYWASDNAGNVESPHTIIPLIDMDQTVPEFGPHDFTYEFVGGNQYQGWDFLFTVNSTDAMSGMNRVEFYANGVLQETVNGSGPTYQWEFRYWANLNIIITATAFDNAGNNITQECYYNPSRQISHNQPKIKQQLLTLLFSRLMDRFPLLEVFLRAMNLLR